MARFDDVFAELQAKISATIAVIVADPELAARVREAMDAAEAAEAIEEENRQDDARANALCTPTACSMLNGNPLIVINKATGGVNYFTLANSATGTALTFAATGIDANIGVNISSKGSAPVQLNSRNAVTRVSVPASATAAGVVDTVAWDSSYFYACTATNTWVRTALATW